MEGGELAKILGRGIQKFTSRLLPKHFKLIFYRGGKTGLVAAAAPMIAGMMSGQSGHHGHSSQQR